MAGPRLSRRWRGIRPAGISRGVATKLLLLLCAVAPLVCIVLRLLPFAARRVILRDARAWPQAPGGLAPPLGPNHGDANDYKDVHDQDPKANQRGGASAQLTGHGARGATDYIELRCEGGKPDVDLSYWKDISQDKAYESPWGVAARKARLEGRAQYVTFEPDYAGFNNIRMAMETVLVFTRETGRTLVIPAAQTFHMIERPAVSFADMFPVEYLEDYMDILPMEEFLEKEGITGLLGETPPGNKTSGHPTEELHQYLRGVADYRPQWNPEAEALVFGPSPENPSVPDDKKSKVWLEQFTKHRRGFEYSEEMQRARHIHFQSSFDWNKSPSGEQQNFRLLTHFYTFLGFVDPAAARHHRRLVRDVVHFREWLFCAAATIVGRLRAAGGGTPGRWSGYFGEWGGLAGGDDGYVNWTESEANAGEGVRREAGFSTLHIRRGGEFKSQYKTQTPPAGTIVEATMDLIRPGEALYIATDEKNRTFFDPLLVDDRRVYYLDDFMDVLEGIHPSYYLMIDTIVASQGRTFIGTWLSTFTGYITRLRGYYRFPTGSSWYFCDDESKGQYLPISLGKIRGPQAPFWRREWPTAWENIDQDLWA